MWGSELPGKEKAPAANDPQDENSFKEYTQRLEQIDVKDLGDETNSYDAGKEREILVAEILLKLDEKLRGSLSTDVALQVIKDFEVVLGSYGKQKDVKQALIFGVESPMYEALYKEKASLPSLASQVDKRFPGGGVGSALRKITAKMSLNLGENTKKDEAEGYTGVMTPDGRQIN